MKEKTLFFDAASTGHHGEFLENLIYGLPRRSAESSVILAHPALSKRLNQAKRNDGASVKLEYLPMSDVHWLSRAKSELKRGQCELALVGHFIQEKNLTSLVLMHMNPHRCALGSWMKYGNISIRGILLAPYISFYRTFNWKQRFVSVIGSIRRRARFRSMLRNPRIDRIFLLNDSRLARDLNRLYRGRHPFMPLVDPIPALSTFLEKGFHRVPCGSNKRHTFLLFGSMDPRKGCLEVIEALRHLAKSTLASVRFRFVGKFREDGYRTQVLEHIERIKSEQPGVQIEIVDRYIDSKEVDYELQQADCVLIPYVGFYGSSGVLGHACRFEKPLIACQEGLIGEIVREKRLGLTIDATNAPRLASAMDASYRKNIAYDESAARDLATAANYRHFSETLVQDWNYT